MGFFDNLGKKLNEASTSLASGQAKQIPDMLRNYSQTNDDSIKQQIASRIGAIMRGLKNGATNGNQDCLRQYEQFKRAFESRFREMEDRHGVRIID